MRHRFIIDSMALIGLVDELGEVMQVLINGQTVPVGHNELWITIGV